MDIVNDKEMDAENKLGKLVEIVMNCRTSYGNEDVEIEVPAVNTVDGYKSIKYLSDEDKVVVAGKEFSDLAGQAIEMNETTKGLVLDKELTSLIACSPILVNLKASTGSSLL